MSLFTQGDWTFNTVVGLANSGRKHVQVQISNESLGVKNWGDGSDFNTAFTAAKLNVIRQLSSEAQGILEGISELSAINQQDIPK